MDGSHSYSSRNSSYLFHSIYFVCVCVCVCDAGDGQEYQLGRSNEKLRSVMYSQGGQEYPAYNKKRRQCN